METEAFRGTDTTWAQLLQPAQSHLIGRSKARITNTVTTAEQFLGRISPRVTDQTMQVPVSGHVTHTLMDQGV